MPVTQSDGEELGKVTLNGDDISDICVRLQLLGADKSKTFADGNRARVIVRSTITSAATVTAAQVAGGVLYQDASGGNVTMVGPTAVLLAAYYPGMAVGDAIPMYMASNHGSNTSTITAGNNVTLVGSGAVINTGGAFLLIKTATTPTFDLVRVG